MKLVTFVSNMKDSALRRDTDCIEWELLTLESNFTSDMEMIGDSLIGEVVEK